MAQVSRTNDQKILIDPVTLRTFEDVQRHSLNDLFALYTSLRPKHGLKKFYDKKQAAKHILTALADTRAAEVEPPAEPPEYAAPIAPELIAEGLKAAMAVETAETHESALAAGPSAEVTVNDPAPEAEAVAGPKRTRGVGGSYQDKLKAFFVDHETGTAEELCALLGCDARNLSVAVAILRNPTRTKDPLRIIYVRGSKTFVKS